MATFKCLATGSSGNSYLLTSHGKTLIVECGVKFDEILKATKFNLKNIVGCIVSHKDGDHIKKETSQQLSKLGVSVYSTNEVADKYEWVSPLTNRITYDIGGFKVMPLFVEHREDVECYAYVIKLPHDEGIILFATDLRAFPYHIKNVGCILIEANYSEEILLNALVADEEIRSQSQNHLEIESAYDVVKRHYNYRLEQVVLLHLSRGLSDERAFCEQIGGIGIPCVAAKPGLELELFTQPF